MSDVDDFLDRPRKKGKKKPELEPEDRGMSYVMGFVLFVFGAGMLVGFYYTQRAPAKLFNLLAAGGAAMVLSGIGLFIHPLNDAEMKEFQNNPNPIAVFRIMPVFWKIWLLVILAAMVAAFVFVAMVTVRVGR